jgi:hypothetical protein
LHLPQPSNLLRRTQATLICDPYANHRSSYCRLAPSLVTVVITRAVDKL